MPYGPIHVWHILGASFLQKGGGGGQICFHKQLIAKKVQIRSARFVRSGNKEAEIGGPSAVNRQIVL